MMNSISGINLLQNFVIILIWKIDKIINKYNKSKSYGLIILLMKFRRYNSQCLYKWETIYCVYFKGRNQWVKIFKWWRISI